MDTAQTRPSPNGAGSGSLMTPSGRSVVITGASRGLGFASAVHLYKRGWQVVGAMRNPEAGVAKIRAACGAPTDDARLIGVRLDLNDAESIASAAKSIEDAVGAPYALVHNAGVTAVGCVEELGIDIWEDMFQTNLFGPVTLTQKLLPSMRNAGKGRIVIVSSAGGIRGMPAIAAYSAVKGASERWAESMANEVSPFGLGVSVLITGTFDTDIITDEGAPDYRGFTGPYSPVNTNLERRGRFATRFAGKPEKFAKGLERVLEVQAPFSRHAVGPDAKMLMISSRLLPSRLLHQATRLAMALPRSGDLRSARAVRD
jgi:NAD(P)-dependent dehydrogenase (short-subunit alcohol dehydrogenase family)